MLERYLAPDEIVHHRDGDPYNNDPQNLLLTTNSEHQRLHHKEREAELLKRARYAYVLRQQGFSTAQIADNMGLHVTNVRRLLRRLSDHRVIPRTSVVQGVLL
jgi:DNA-directed RNA polymerase specialized sigma24 family protein